MVVCVVCFSISSPTFLKAVLNKLLSRLVINLFIVPLVFSEPFITVWANSVALSLNLAETSEDPTLVSLTNLSQSESNLVVATLTSLFVTICSISSLNSLFTLLWTEDASGSMCSNKPCLASPVSVVNSTGLPSAPIVYPQSSSKNPTSGSSPNASRILL